MTGLAVGRLAVGRRLGALALAGWATAQRLMGAYLVRRLLLVIPTLFGIIAINFVVVQFAPGGPVEQMIAELKGHGGSATGRMSGAGSIEVMPTNTGEATAAPAASTRTSSPTSSVCSASTSLPRNVSC